jgi:hypothetical protein
MMAEKKQDQDQAKQEESKQQEDPYSHVNYDSEPVEVGTDAPESTELKHHGVAQGVEVTEATTTESQEEKSGRGQTDNS